MTATRTRPVFANLGTGGHHWCVTVVYHDNSGSPTGGGHTEGPMFHHEAVRVAEMHNTRTDQVASVTVLFARTVSNPPSSVRRP